MDGLEMTIDASEPVPHQAGNTMFETLIDEAGKV